MTLWGINVPTLLCGRYLWAGDGLAGEKAGLWRGLGMAGTGDAIGSGSKRNVRFPRI